MRTRSAARNALGGTRTAAPGQGDTPPTVARRGESPDVPAARPVRRGIPSENAPPKIKYSRCREAHHRPRAQ